MGSKHTGYELVALQVVRVSGREENIGLVNEEDGVPELTAFESFHEAFVDLGWRGAEIARADYV